MTIKKIAKGFLEIIKSIAKGDIILRLRMDKALPFILYTFILAWLNILLNLGAEKTMLTAEKNKRDLETLKIYHTQKTIDLVELDRISSVDTELKKLGSEVSIPQKPAEIIKD